MAFDLLPHQAGFAPTAPQRAWRTATSLAAGILIAGAFLAGHAGSLARAPDSIDATNFVLGVRDFDVARHQPHPPGYPVYVALGRVARELMPETDGSPDRSVAEARALSWLGLTLGALAVFPLAWLFRGLDRPLTSPLLAVAAAVLVLACPLYWFSAGRPMSDVPGLAVTALAQALLVAAIARLWPLDRAVEHQQSRARTAGWLVVAAAFLAGLACGVRVQTLLQTLPLLLTASWLLGRRTGRWAGAGLAAGVAVAGGALVWLGPLALSTSYLETLNDQAVDDFTGGYMLALDASPRALVAAFRVTFIDPWGHAGLGAVIVSLAALGCVRLWQTGPRRLALLVAAAAPYGVFHLLFQDTDYPRYALPLVPPTAWLAANGLVLLAGRAAAPLALTVAAVGVLVAAQPTREHFRVGSPAVRALADVREQSTIAPPRVIAMHRAVWQALRSEPLPATLDEPSQGYEWLAVADYWVNEGDGPVWFLANRRRTDLAFMDADGRRLVRSYAWTYDRRPYLGQARPGGVDWYELTPPSWFVMKGWSLTPEMAGLAAVERRTGIEPLVAYVRRRTAPTLMAVGGRVLDAGASGTRVEVALDGQPLAVVPVDETGTFLHAAPIPQALLAGPPGFAQLTVAASGSDSARPLGLAVDQFDIQSPGGSLLAFGEGWHQAEYEFERGEMWRWTARRASLRLSTFGQSVVLRLRGGLPHAYPGGVSLDVRVGSVKVARFLLSGDFDIDVPLDGGRLQDAGDVLWIEPDRAWVPADAGESPDRRELGLRIVDVEVRARHAGPAHAWQPTRQRHPFQ